MRSARWFCLFFLTACGDKDSASTDDTGPGDTAGEAPADDTGPDDTGDSGDTGPSGACATPTAYFTGTYGIEMDLTAALTDGTWTTIEDPGVLEICPGTWFTRLILRADVDVIGLGDGPEDTILSGGDSGTILDIAGPGVVVRVENATLDRGAGLYQKKYYLGGGGVACSDGAAVFVQDAIFSNNSADDGAALYGRECEIDVTSAEFVDNAVVDDGGAVTLWYSTASFTDVTLTGNSALDGGAMALLFSEVDITDAYVADNAASWFAAGIWTFESALTLVDAEIVDNTNSGDFGGGLLAYGDVALAQVSFDGNAAAQGGGLYIYANSTVEGASVDFLDNAEHDVWIGDNTKAGGQAVDAGAGVTFSCADNVCTGF